MYNNHINENRKMKTNTNDLFTQASIKEKKMQDDYQLMKYYKKIEKYKQ